ncbi:MAG TPA: hypothetical protein PLA50_00340 [Bacteroidia bacterium]|nr:hypothetical protein [Bacteroidia bacterium]
MARQPKVKNTAPPVDPAADAPDDAAAAPPVGQGGQAGQVDPGKTGKAMRPFRLDGRFVDQGEEVTLSADQVARYGHLVLGVFDLAD